MTARHLLGKIAAFEFRYQARSPLFIVAATLLFLLAFADMAGAKLITIGGGNVLSNSPHAIIVSHLAVSLGFLFLGAAFVSNAVVRDDQTRFGPILRATGIGKADYLFGRFLGAFAAGALAMAAATLGQWLGTPMPFADQAMLGPNRLAAFAYGYGLFALPNALIVSCVLFALATATRSTAGTFIGVVVLLVLYFVSQSLVQELMPGQPGPHDLRALADPLGMTAYMAASRYFTAAELNAGAVPVTGLMVLGRMLWTGAALLLLALAWHRFRFEERGSSRWRQRRLRRQAGKEAAHPAAGQDTRVIRLAQPRFDRRAALAQFATRAGMEARYIFRSPVFLVLLVIAFAFTLPGLLAPSGWMGVPLHPLASVIVPTIQEGFGTLLVVIATYYGGELVWRERERNTHEIIDATPLPAWALMLPKMLGLALVLFATLLAGMAAGVFAQWLQGGVDPAPGEYLLWYLLPGGVDAVLVAVLAVFVQALAPSKHAGWGLMALYLVARVFGPSLGLEHPLLLFGNVPAVPLSDMAGMGGFWPAAWWFRLFWGATAVLMLVATHLLWPRGTDARLLPRLRRMPTRWGGGGGAMALAAGVLVVLAGAWIAYNTLVLNDFRSGAETQRYLAEYEKRFFRYARLPHPVVRHVELEVALFPEAVRAEVRGRYTLVNDTASPIERLHVRLMNRDLDLIALDIPAARLELGDERFDYRIYRFDAPMQPGESRTLSFRTRRQQSGFRASGTETSLTANGTDLDTLELTPRIGMSDIGLIDEPDVRRRHGLPERRPFPRLDDLAATRLQPGGDAGWTTADITVSTRADQVPVAPGKRVSERVQDGRRIARFVSEAPIKNFFSIQSARYAVRKQVRGGVEYAIYFHPAHGWNVDRMMAAMQASIAYYREAFGPYQFDRARIVETPAYRQGGQAFANTVPVGETAGFAMDLRDPDAIDMASVVAAHEIAHQWWGHQVLGARMQGAGLLYETLAQYSALMVMKRLEGEDKIRRLLRYQLDRYLSGRRTQVLEEQPLVGVEIAQRHIAYGKGALAMYLLQQRMGEDAVNRALRRFVERYRFTTAPYPRSVDLVALLREEARTAEQRALIADLFERITLYDLQVRRPTAAPRPDGRWDVTVPVAARKLYANGRGEEREAPLDATIEIGLFTAEPGSGAFDRGHVVRIEPRKVRSGTQAFRFVTRQRPTHAGVDPYNFYIDRDSGDNVEAVAPVPPRRSAGR